MDKTREAALGKEKIGTTLKGIGPCYEDKAARLDLRMGDLRDPVYLRDRLEHALALKNKELAAYGAKTFTVDEILEPLLEQAKKIVPHLTDTSVYLYKAYKAGKKILFEGAQGSMLCLTHGTYPYVTSSSPLATAIPLNTGLPLDAVNDIMGIMKAYTTRVGAGPFPTELLDETGNTIREKGHEYGTVTKRPRRVGWLDLAELGYVVRISGVKHVSLMLLDVLGGLKEIKVCTGYLMDGKPIDYMPAGVNEYENVKPVYKTLPSWQEDISGIRNYDDLPEAAKNYVSFIEKHLGVEVDLISVGPDKDATIVRKEIF